ncbi:orotidine-5'-phosphate decarboxylase [Candidatus Saganbacteria bacterium]|nr:orotidine-5'-phosphate decarboxylase [Candidatus Saganbacteria bacterium]
MNFLSLLDRTVKKNNSLVCVGLDVDIASLPASAKTLAERIISFNQGIIKATKDLVCAYKPNSAFYEQYGLAGISALLKTIEYIKSQTNIPVILDVKRGDIGHSSAAYAASAFKIFQADAVTVNPYMGFDSLEPFLNYEDKGVFILCLTSNPGAKDFETSIYKNVADKAKKWNKSGNLGLVVGATKPEELKKIRQIVPDLPLLIPGVGVQGGDIAATVKNGVNKNGGRAIINSSRGIIYAQDPRAETQKLRDQINEYRNC